MRARTYKAAHRNLADSKRSIVMICAGLAMVLGTTSVGASMFSLGNDPTLIERTGSSVGIDANGDNEVRLDEPTVQILQGQANVIPRKPHLPLPSRNTPAPQELSTQVATSLLNQLHNAGHTTDTITPPVTTNPGSDETTTPTDPVIVTDPDPDETTGGGDGGIEEDPPAPDNTSPGNSQLQQPATNMPIQGSSTTQDTII